MTDNDSKTPNNRAGKSSSFSAQVLDLEVSESCMKHHAPSSDFALTSIASELPRWREQLRNTVQPTIRRAKEQTGGTYTCEITDLFTSSGRLFIIAIVTRTA